MSSLLYKNLIKPHLYNEKIFLIHDDETTTSYKDFICLASQIAHQLSELGLSAEDCLIVKSPKSKETLALYIASILTGSIYLPLNSSYTPTETEYFIKDSNPAFVICEESESDALKTMCEEVNAKLITLNSDGTGDLTKDINLFPEYYTPINKDSDDLCALLYTSGTTGKAKGAMLTHQNLFSNAKELVDLWEITSQDTLIHSLPIFHTHGLFVAINTSMMGGSSIRFIEGFNIDYIINSFNNSTLLMGVPTFYTRLLNDERLSTELTKNMRLFISGSAPLLRETHKNFEKITGHKILERYGMTETNMNTSNPYKEERKAGSVGKPLKNITVRVVNSENEKVLKSGEIGMIQVKGPNIFKGYLNMPDKTQESFTKDGFFITGDLGSFDKDGYLSITGRNKDLIISGGYNIYPKEIEDIINRFDKVIECAVFGINDKDLGEVPVAVVVMKHNENDTLSLKDYVKKNLAKYKQPKEFYCLEQLPKNTMGKIQKNILKEMFNS